jgi:hydrogenase maturation protease
VAGSSYWEELERPGPDVVTVEGVALRAGSRVRLRPRAGADVFDLALSGRTALVQSIEQDLDGRLALALIVEDDPGRDLGAQRQIGHRFFFAPEEVEPLPDQEGASTAPRRRVLVAGIGNVFLGDDGFGVALAGRLARREWPRGVDVVDFGIRGMDLAYALLDGYDAALLLDATPRGQAPGTLYVIEPDPDEGSPALETHAMDPVKVLALARTLGGTPPRTLVLGCEPRTAIAPDDENLLIELSAPVHAALDEGVRLVETLVSQLTATDEMEVSKP